MGLEIKNIKLGVEPYWSWKRDSIMINRGQVIHLTGKNGEGKSSILRLMMGLMMISTCISRIIKTSHL